MEILIDNQKVVDVEFTTETPDGNGNIVLGIEAVNTLLGAWLELDPKRRWFSWPAQRDYEDMAVVWYSDAAGLVAEWVSPFWDGREEHDAHSLQAISSALPADMLKWGDAL